MATRRPQQPKSDPNHVVDPPPMAVSVPGPVHDMSLEPQLTDTPQIIGDVVVRVLRSENAAVGEAHYSLRAGETMVLPSTIADELHSQRLVEILR